MIQRERNMILGAQLRNKWEWAKELNLMAILTGNIDQLSMQKNSLERYLVMLDSKVEFLVISRILQSRSMVSEQLKKYGNIIIFYIQFNLLLLYY